MVNRNISNKTSDRPIEQLTDYAAGRQVRRRHPQRQSAACGSNGENAVKRRGEMPSRLPRDDERVVESRRIACVVEEIARWLHEGACSPRRFHAQVWMLREKMCDVVHRAAVWASNELVPNE